MFFMFTWCDYISSVSSGSVKVLVLKRVVLLGFLFNEVIQPSILLTVRCAVTSTALFIYCYFRYFINIISINVVCFIILFSQLQHIFYSQSSKILNISYETFLVDCVNIYIFLHAFDIRYLIIIMIYNNTSFWKPKELDLFYLLIQVGQNPYQKAILSK